MTERTCSSCDLFVTYAAGTEPQAGWWARGLCLACRRAHLVAHCKGLGLRNQEIARELAAFEIERTPNSRPSEIALRKVSPRLSQRVVAEVRAELIVAGTVKPLGAKSRSRGAG